MKFFVYLISLSTLLLSNNAGALSLNEAIDESLANNLLLKMEANAVDIAEEDYFQSKTSYLPSINISANIAETEYSNTVSYTHLTLPTNREV